VQGIRQTVEQLEAGLAEVENAYARVVTRLGNPAAQQVISQVFEVCDRNWRGIGRIPASGWKLRKEYVPFDAELRFQVQDLRAEESPLCIAGQILQGLRRPGDCPAFGKECTPEHPLGATMVSSEGACSAYYRYGRDAGSISPAAELERKQPV
jgi:hydrogenase expression/formation protein HypD